MSVNKQTIRLFAAVQESNNESVVRALIDAGADVNITDDDGQTALVYAVQQSNNESVVRALIDAGADVNIKIQSDFGEINGQTALSYAIQQSNNDSVVRALIDAGADVNKTDYDGQTALFYAVQQHNNESVVRALIDAGADVNITDNHGQSALFYAVRHSNNESVICTLIYECNDILTFRDTYGRTAIFYAESPIIFSYLLKKEGNQCLHLKDNCKVDVLTVVIERIVSDEKTFASFENKAEIFDLWIKPYGMKREYFTKAIIDLMFNKAIGSLFKQKYRYIYFLMPSILDAEKSIDTYYKPLVNLANLYNENVADNEEDIKNNFERIVMMLKEDFQSGISKALEFLVELGADPNSVDSDGNTALHYATRLPLIGASEETVMHVCHQLQKYGVQFNTRNHQNETPLLFCLSGDITKVSERQLQSAIKTQVEVCRFLLKRGSATEERSRSGQSIFHLIIKLFQQAIGLRDKTIRENVIQELIKLFEFFSPSKVAKSSIINIPDAQLNSPLHLWASLEFPQKYTNLYLWYSHGDTDSVGKDDTRSAEYNTFERDLQTALKCLLKCGAKLNARNNNEETPLHLCKTWSAVKLLIAAGANPNNVDLSGCSPLLVAAKNKTFLKKNDHFYSDVSEDPKTFWKTAIKKELDPWTVDKQGECLLGILIKKEAFVLAKTLVDVACEEKYTQSETEAVLLLNSICKDKSTKTHWKVNLVQDILKSRKCRTTASTPLRLCCKNIIETGVFAGKREDETDLTGEGINDDELPSNKKQRMDESSTVDKAQKDFQKNPAIYNSVHYKIMNLLLCFGADSRSTVSSGESCLDIAKTCPALKEFLMKPIDINEIPQFTPWTSVSKNYEDKLAKVARRQDCEVVNQFWYHKDCIGSGSFGHVFAGINEKDGREVAIKRIETLRIQRPEDKREITNLTHLADCEQVVRYLLFSQDEKFSYIVLELMEGNLDECLNVFKLGTQKRNKLCKDVVMGVQYLHKQNILHRDLKPANILYKTHPEQCLKIADFGLSRRIDSISTTVYGTNAGTRCWIAPEVLKSIATVDHSKSSDMFSCGLLLHYILSDQKHPFSPADCENKSERIIANETETNIMNSKMEGWDNSLSPEATHLVTKILERDEKKRSNAGEALDHLLFWSQKEKIDLLTAVGNQPVFEFPRAGKSTCLTAVEADLEKSFSTIVRYGKWNDPRYSDMPAIYTEMTQKRKSYDTASAVELVRLIRNAYAHVSEDKRPTRIRKLLLEDFVFLDYFPHLVMEVYKVVTTHGWDQTRDEVKYAMNK